MIAFVWFIASYISGKFIQQGEVVSECVAQAIPVS